MAHSVEGSVHGWLTQRQIHHGKMEENCLAHSQEAEQGHRAGEEGVRDHT